MVIAYLSMLFGFNSGAAARQLIHLKSLSKKNIKFKIYAIIHSIDLPAKNLL